MDLNERLSEDFKEAMRSKDEHRLSALRLLRAAVKNAEVAKGRPLEEGEVVEAIARQIRQGEESIEQFKKGGRLDLIAREEGQLAALKPYVPQQLSRDEIAAAVNKAISETGAKGPQDKGKVMPLVIGQLRGRAGGREINEVVTELLGQSSKA